MFMFGFIFLAYGIVFTTATFEQGPTLGALILGGAMIGVGSLILDIGIKSLKK